MLKHNKPYKHGYRILTVDRTTSGLDYALLLGKERLSALLAGANVAVFLGLLWAVPPASAIKQIETMTHHPDTTIAVLG